MAVKNAAKATRQATVDDDVAEFASLLNATLRNLRSAGPPPSELRDAVDRASLGKRHWPALLQAR
jgi:hypothetical protein